jgi:predicted RNA-binding Zn ribbon-like protein
LHFAPDTDETLQFVAALVNTAPGASKSATDEIATPAALTAFLDAAGFTGRFDRDEGELADVRRTRERFRAIWTLGRDDAVTEVNAILGEAHALPQLLRHDGFDWHIHATPQDAPLAERIRVEAAMAFIDVIRTTEWGRMRECGAPDCTGVLVDLSRNGSKRFCSVRCGNRVNMIAFRERQSSAS